MVDPVTAAKGVTVAATTVGTFWDIKASELLKFFSGVTAAVAWPLAAVFIVNLFKKEIIERIPRLSELTLPGGISAKFKEGLSEVEAKTEKEDLIPSETGSAPHKEVHRIRTTDATSAQSDLLETFVVDYDKVALRANPTGVVMEAWKSIEQVLRQCALELGAPASVKFPPRIIVNSLRNKGFISHDEEISILELLELRNLVAHVPNKTVTDVDAQRFATLAERFKGKLLAKITRYRVKNGGHPPSTASGNS